MRVALVARGEICIRDRLFCGQDIAVYRVAVASYARNCRGGGDGAGMAAAGVDVGFYVAHFRGEESGGRVSGVDLPRCVSLKCLSGMDLVGVERKNGQIGGCFVGRKSLFRP